MAKTTKSKKLSLNSIKKANQQYSQQKKIYVNINGNNEEVLIDQCFSPTKIKMLLNEYLLNCEKINKTNLDNKQSLEVIYLNFLIMKYFSDISFLKKVDDFQDQISLINGMVDAQVFVPITKAFDEKECKKILDEMELATKRIQNYLDEIKENSEFDKGMKEIESINKTVDDIINSKNDNEDIYKNTDNKKENK